MTLVLFLTLATAFTALVEVMLFTTWRNSGKISEAIYPVMIASALFLPVAVYLILTYAVPDIGTIKIF